MSKFLVHIFLCAKLFCSIVDEVARISINIQEVLAVLFSYSALQPRIAPSHYITGVHHHADHVAKWDFVFSEKRSLGQFPNVQQSP